MFKITSEDIAEAQVREVVESPESGAVVLFLGTVRDNTDGHQVKHLEYEAYTPWRKEKLNSHLPRQMTGKLCQSWLLTCLANSMQIRVISLKPIGVNLFFKDFLIITDFLNMSTLFSPVGTLCL